MFRLSIIAFLVLSAIALALPRTAHAQVHRCTAADGTQLFTDRRCVDVGATDSLDRAAAPDASHATAAPGCKRNLRDMVFEVSTAIDSRDVNRLAGVYDWSGLSTGNGYALLGRLDAIVQRPLVDIVPVSPEEPASPEKPVSDASDTTTGTGNAAPPIHDADAAPPPRIQRPPVALRVEQTLANGSTPSRTVFGLRRNMGCWWITL
jgi:hypothetical protein